MEDRSIYFYPAHSQFLYIFLSFRFVSFQFPQRSLLRIVHVSLVFDYLLCCFVLKLMRSFISSRDVVFLSVLSAFTNCFLFVGGMSTCHKVVPSSVEHMPP